MTAFDLTDQPIDGAALQRALAHPGAGAQVVFAGAVRDHHAGGAVRHLDYEAYAPLARNLGQAILTQAAARWPLLRAHACHRLGHLTIGELAVWVGVASPHRGDAFAACAWIMDTIKTAVPIWKRETYADGSVAWSQGTVIAADPHP